MHHRGSVQAAFIDLRLRSPRDRRSTWLPECLGASISQSISDAENWLSYRDTELSCPGSLPGNSGVQPRVASPRLVLEDSSGRSRRIDCQRRARSEQRSSTTDGVTVLSLSRQGQSTAAPPHCFPSSCDRTNMLASGLLCLLMTSLR
jgi:hypothetical protein